GHLRWSTTQGRGCVDPLRRDPDRHFAAPPKSTAHRLSRANSNDSMNGRYKPSPEAFEVEELPAYDPNGEGEHLFLWVEKRGVSTPEAAKRIARQLGLTERDVSWAGLKDKQALTRQLICVPSKVEGAVPM